MNLQSYKKKHSAEVKVDYKYNPVQLAPGGTKKMPVIEQLRGQAKEAFTKVWNRAEELRNLKGQVDVHQAEITKLNNVIKDVKKRELPPINGYIQMLFDAREKMDMAEGVAYAYKTKEEAVLASLTQRTEQEYLPGQDPIKRNAEKVVELLITAGKLTQQLVDEGYAMIDKLNAEKEYISVVTRSLNIFPPAKTDKIESSKQAGVLEILKDWYSKVVDWFQSSLSMISTLTAQLEDNFDEIEALI